jgi:serine/threonine-protein kinase
VLGALGLLAGRRWSSVDGAPLAMQILPGPDHRLGAPYANNIALSPDGRAIVYVAQGPAGRQLYVRQLDAFTSAPVPGTQNAYSDPAFSPDGHSVIYVGVDGGVFRAPVIGGQASQVGTASICCTLEWSERGILYSTLSGVELVPLSGGAPRRLGRIGLPGPTAVSLPGGKAILYLSAGSTHHVEALDLATARSTRVEGLPEAVDDIAWSDGYLLLQVGTNLEAVAFDARRLRARGEPVMLVQGVRLGASGGVRESQSSVSGSDLAYVPASGTNRIVIVDRDGRSTMLPDTSGSFHRPRFSPDGRRVSVDITREQGRDVWVYDMDQRTMSRITFQTNGHDAIWADNRTLLYAASASDSSLGIYGRHTDGSAEVDTILEAPVLDAPEALTKNGREVLAYAQSPVTSVDAWLVSRTGRTHRVLMGAPYAEAGLSLSRDGRWLAFASDESGRAEVYVRALEGGPRLQVSTAGGREPVWAPNGGELFYRTQSDKGSRLMSARMSFAPLRVVTRDTLFAVTDYEEADPHADYDVSPDGRRFVFIRQEMPNEIRVIRNWKALLRALETRR